MTTIDPASYSPSTTSTSTSMAVTGAGRPGRPDMAKAMAPVADALGMSGDDLRTALASGKSLDQLASQQRLSHDDLVAAITKGLQETTPANAPADVDLSAMAERIASHVRGADGPRHAGHAHRHATGAVDVSQGLSTLAGIVGLDESTLRQGLESGSDLSEVLRSSGIDQTALSQRLLQGSVVDAYA
jgi:DNA-binding phage protein